MLADLDRIKRDLISEICLEPVQAGVYLLINTRGMMDAPEIARGMGIGAEEAQKAAADLAEKGALIDVSGKFEAMHPRFTAVNMYRRMCRQRGIEPGQNKTVDGIGAALEPLYDDARTGGPKPR